MRLKLSRDMLEHERIRGIACFLADHRLEFAPLLRTVTAAMPAVDASLLQPNARLAQKRPAADQGGRARSRRM